MKKIVGSEVTIFVYNAGGTLVAEYGQKSDGLGGVKYIQQDWQGSVRTVTNANGFVVARTDHQAFGGEIGYGTGLRSIDQGYNVQPATTQGYGLTERDNATGLDHTWFRKNENAAGRWTSPDPYLGSMELGDPQSLNRYSYVVNQPTNFVDPSGLMRVCWFTSWTECNDVTVVDDGELSSGNSSGGCSLGTGWKCIDIGGGGGWNPVILNVSGDSGGSVGGGDPPVQPPDSDCRKREERKCYEEGRDYFNANAPWKVVRTILGLPTLGATVGSAWAKLKSIPIKRMLQKAMSKTSLYGLTIASVWTLYDVTQAAIAIENACKKHIAKTCGT